MCKHCAGQDHPRYQKGKKMDLVHATEPAVGMNIAIRKHGTIHKVNASVPGILASRQAKIIGQPPRRGRKKKKSKGYHEVCHQKA
jgi:hypothetical protein